MIDHYPGYEPVDLGDGTITATAQMSVGHGTLPPAHWLIYIHNEGARGGLRYDFETKQLVFEGENVAESGRAFFEAYRDVVQRFIDEVKRYE